MAAGGGVQVFAGGDGLGADVVVFVGWVGRGGGFVGLFQEFHWFAEVRRETASGCEFRRVTISFLDDYFEIADEFVLAS